MSSSLSTLSAATQADITASLSYTVSAAQAAVPHCISPCHDSVNFANLCKKANVHMHQMEFNGFGWKVT